MTKSACTANTATPRPAPAGRRLRALFRRGGEEGSALLEFGVSLPLLLFITTGIFQFGITIANYVMLTNATSIGALQLAISRGQTLDPCNTVSAAVFAAAPTLTQSSFTFAYVLDGHSYSGTSCSSTSNTTGAPSYLVQGSTATVTVTYPCNLRIYALNNFTNCTLTAKTAELVQ
jgi:Flp pilus assembly protein TadG